jgi:hypothetical protein
MKQIKWALCGALILLVACSKSNFATQSAAVSYQQVPVVSNKVDILFIDDDSSAMLSYREKLAGQAQAIVQKLTAAGIDYHIAVTPTSYGASYLGGTFVGSPTDILSTTPNPGVALAANLNFTLPGSDLQQSFTSMLTALSPINLNGPGAGFLRPDAMLVVIVVSSDDDYSSAPVGSYEDFLNSIKPAMNNRPRSWVFNYIGTTSLNTSCGQFVNVGSRYIQMAKDSDGIVQSICNADWTAVTNNINVVIQNLFTDYYLTKQPVLSSIVVTVNGAPVTQDPKNGWSLNTGKDTAGNTTYYIRFNGTSLPSIYSKINVSFTPATAN